MKHVFSVNMSGVNNGLIIAIRPLLNFNILTMAKTTPKPQPKPQPKPNPQWPSKNPGKKSGPDRGNNPPKN